MTNPIDIHFRTEVREEDRENIRSILVSTGFFYDIEIPVAVELAEEHLQSGPGCGYFFIFAEVGGKTIAYACYGPIPGTVGSYDLYWIATHDSCRGQGIGSRLIEAVHEAIVAAGGRLVIAETSTLDKYRPTRHFYERTGYLAEARIDVFYRKGDGKVFYVKRF